LHIAYNGGVFFLKYRLVHFKLAELAMKQIVGIGLLVAGIVLLCLSWNSYHSTASGVSRVVTGTSTDKTVWLLVGGIVGTAAGLGSLFTGSRKA
jgi:Protein of unknown function (DUF3185)